ncbi:MAG: deoxyribonuclease IV [Gemmataceae bacterium]|nr:deoxyribonuclease IV [Gemmataceae bacterium]
MPLFGAHMSIAGGLSKAIDAATTLELETVQIFTHSPSQWSVQPTTDPKKPWAAKALADDAVSAFRTALAASSLQCATAHDSYLINLASPDETLYQRSLTAFTAEMHRAEALGLAYLVMHPGTPTDGDEKAGIKRIVRAFDKIHKACAKFKVMVLLETTAGQGMTLGHRFEHLAAILDGVKDPDQLGVCLDTCHVFAAGYPLAPSDDYEKTFKNFDVSIGLDKLKLFHVNDSKKPFGSRVDRHEWIGHGHLGLEPFRLLVNDMRFAKLPMILETPKEGPNGEAMDPVNLRTLRELIGKKKSA